MWGLPTNIGPVSVLPSAAGYADGTTCWIGATQYVVAQGAWVVIGGPTKLDRYLRIATFGDSTADFGGTGKTDTEKMYVAFPGSGSTEFGNWQSKTTVAYWQPCLVVANGGWGGQTTTQFIGRGKNAYSSTRKAMQDVLRKRPDVVLMHGGSINDYFGFTAATPQATIDAVVSRHRQCVEFFTGAGVHVIDSGTFGYSVPGANLSAVCSIIVQTNATLKALAARDPLWHFVDVSGVLHDGTGLYKAGVSFDNVHLNNLGGYLLGQQEKAVLDTLFVTGSSGDIIWDQQGDYSNANNNGPVNQGLGYESLSIVSRKTESGSYVVTVDVTDYTNAGLRQYIDCVASGIKAAGILAQDALTFESFVRVRDSNGNIVLGSNATFRIRIPDPTNTVEVYYDQYHGANTGGWIARQWSSPIDASTWGSNAQVILGCSFPANGIYTVEFRPCRIRRYTPMNVLP